MNNFMMILRLIWSEHKISVIVVTGVIMLIVFPYIPIDGVDISCDGYSVTTFTTHVSLFQIITSSIDIAPNCLWSI